MKSKLEYWLNKKWDTNSQLLTYLISGNSFLLTSFCFLRLVFVEKSKKGGVIFFHMQDLRNDDFTTHYFTNSRCPRMCTLCDWLLRVLSTLTRVNQINAFDTQYVEILSELIAFWYAYIFILAFQIEIISTYITYIF